jgi:shikimate dehydrogenase
MPLKHAALACMDEVSETARVVEAVNTVLIESDGSRHGDNTDVLGMVRGLQERGVTRVAAGAVFGGGATARSALAALHQVADSETVYVRTPARADGLLATAAALGLDCTVRPWDERYDGLTAPVVIVATPAGASDDLAGSVPGAPGALLDVVYSSGSGPLSAAWAAAGGVVVSGLDLLVHQAVRQVRLMTGRDVPVSVLRDAGTRALAARIAASG